LGSARRRSKSNDDDLYEVGYVSDDPDFDQKLNNVLKTRIGFEWPYAAQFEITKINLEIWLESNCKGEYRIFIGRHEKLVYFKNQDDFIVYQLTWG
jgi:hypothetical protein